MLSIPFGLIAVSRTDFTTSEDEYEEILHRHLSDVGGFPALASPRTDL
ncbi:hypothetical protein [Streptomyces virginiae]